MKGVVYTEIKVIDGSFSVCKVTDFSEVDPSKKFNFISATDEENSLICLTENELALRIDGLTLDAVYDNFVKQVAELQGEEWNANCGAAENVAQSLAREKLKKQIAALEKKMKSEKQLNRRMEINAELKKLRIELKHMS